MRCRKAQGVVLQQQLLELDNQSCPTFFFDLLFFKGPSQGTWQGSWTPRPPLTRVLYLVARNGWPRGGCYVWGGGGLFGGFTKKLVQWYKNGTKYKIVNSRPYLGLLTPGVILKIITVFFRPF
jgi:hypothetical protein